MNTIRTQTIRITAVCLAVISLTAGLSGNIWIRAEEPPNKREQFLDRELPTAEGTTSSLRRQLGTRATAVIFINTECPISNGYVNTLNEFAKQFASQGVTVVGLNPNDGVSLPEMAAHRKEFAIAFPVLRDLGAIVADQLGARHCPEAVLIDTHGTVQYKGRIDERYTKRGGAANEIRRHDLMLATEQFLASKPISVTRTEVIGCPIFRSRKTQQPDQTSRENSVTYSEHIAPLLQDNCLSCHRPGGIGPFALDSFEQAVSWADDIKEFTSNRQMPPWLPAEGFGEFHNRRSMSQAEIALIAKWVDGGCVAGDLKKVPAAPVFKDGWTLGEPDLIIQTDTPFNVPPDGKDLYHCFVIPTDFDDDQFVSGVEVRPGNNRVVHHILTFIDTSNRSTQLDAESPGQGYATSAGFPGFLPAGGMGGWAPGNQPQTLRDGMARVLPAKCKIVIQIHYHPSGKPETDQTRIGLHFAKTPVTRTVRVLPVMPFGGPLSGMRIPAGDANSEVRTSMFLPRDSLVLNVTPHMHLLGKDLKLTATLPNGKVQPLIFVPRWDFNWQESYQYLEPIPLPKGTRLDLVAHYDNSAENPANPNSPPKEVRWGEQTSSEMCIAFLQLVPQDEAKSPRDLKAPAPGELLRDALFSRQILGARSK